MQAVIASKGRLVIPKEIRDALGVGDGDSVEINLDGASAASPHALGGDYGATLVKVGCTTYAVTR